MTGPIHFVDVRGALQELGPGATIQFNGRNGTRQEIVFVGRTEFDQTMATIYNLEQTRQELVAREQSLRSEIDTLKTSGRVMQTEASVTAKRIQDSSQALSDRLDLVKKCIETTEGQLLESIASLRGQYLETASLSTANSVTLEALARFVTSSLAVLGESDEQQVNQIAQLDDRLIVLGLEVPNVWESISALRSEMETEHDWSMSRYTALSDRIFAFKRMVHSRLHKMRRLHVVELAVGSAALILAIIGLFV